MTPACTHAHTHATVLSQAQTPAHAHVHKVLIQKAILVQAVVAPLRILVRHPVRLRLSTVCKCVVGTIQELRARIQVLCAVYRRKALRRERRAASAIGNTLAVVALVGTVVVRGLTIRNVAGGVLAIHVAHELS